jgi:hypothetical protein
MSWYIKTFEGSELMFVLLFKVTSRRFMIATLVGPNC